MNEAGEIGNNVGRKEEAVKVENLAIGGRKKKMYRKRNPNFGLKVRVYIAVKLLFRSDLVAKNN